MTIANPLKRHSLEWATRLFAAVFSAVSWAGAAGSALAVSLGDMAKEAADDLSAYYYS